MKAQKQTTALRLILVLFLSGRVEASPQPAQPQPLAVSVAHLTKKEAASFNQALIALAQETHTTIVVEDQPLKTTLAPQAVPAVPVKGEALSILLPRIAAAYDYDVLPLEDDLTPGHVFLLKKHFTDPSDLPDVTLAECSAAFKDVALLIKPYEPNFAQGAIEDTPTMRDFLLSLTPAQMQALADKERGLPVASLTPPQQEAVRHFAMFFYVQLPTRSLQPALKQMGTAAGADPQFCRRDINEIMQAADAHFVPLLLFGFEVPNAVGTPFFTLLNRVGLMDQQDGALTIQDLKMEDGFYTLPERPDPTDPTPQAKTPPVFGASLAEVTDRLNHRAGSHPPMLVETALAPKRAAVFGEEFAPPKQVFQALAELYGLHIDTDDKGRSHLARRPSVAPEYQSELYQAAQAVMPDPLLRAYRQHPGNPAPLYTAAVQHLRTVIEPKINTSLMTQARGGKAEGAKEALGAVRAGRVPLSSLTSREESAMAVALAAKALPDIEAALPRPLPMAFSRLDQLCLTGGFYQDQGKRKFQLAFASPAADGKSLASGPGVSNMTFPSQPGLTPLPAPPDSPNR